MAPNDSSELIQGPCCAHLHVDWATIEEGGLTYGWWECQMCKTKFMPTPLHEHVLTRSREEAASAALALLGEVLQAVEELYPQTYQCMFGSSEYTHINPEDWRDAMAKIRTVQERLASLKADAEGRPAKP